MNYEDLSQIRVSQSGIPEGALSAAWDAIGLVVKVWATEGHSIAIPIKRRV